MGLPLCATLRSAGDDEAEKGKAQLKNMETGEKTEVNLKANDIKAVIRS